jgi:hypothetical protein
MRTIIAVSLAGMIVAGAALAQSTDNRVNSGAGVSGQPGNKSGPPPYRDQNTGQPSHDQSNVPGLPGNKSGPAAQPPKGTK